jgi:hypothetical protein
MVGRPAPTAAEMSAVTDGSVGHEDVVLSALGGNIDAACRVVPGFDVIRRVLQNKPPADLDIPAERELAVVRDVNGQWFVLDDLGPVGPDNHRSTGSEASADDFESTTPEGVHPRIGALGDEDGDFSCRDAFAAAGSKHAQRYCRKQHHAVPFHARPPFCDTDYDAKDQHPVPAWDRYHQRALMCTPSGLLHGRASRADSGM